MRTFNPEELRHVSAEILGAGPICDECLGRVGAKLGTGLSNAARGREIRALLAVEGIEGKPGTCWVCGDLFADLDEWTRRAVDLCCGREFATYLFGVVLTPRLEQMEAFYVQRFPSDHRESLKHAINRAAGIAFEKALGRPATVDFRSPHLSFVIDLNTDTLDMHVLSLYLYGRYRKLERGIPQTKWPCRRCRGRGCDVCGFTGKQYPDSVEETVAAPLIELAEAESACLHGAGREDIDARMLGGGRPFVLELVRPGRRCVDVAPLHRIINERAAGRVEVTELRFVDRRAVEWVKETRATKRYQAVVEFGEGIDSKRLQQALDRLTGGIAQQTPRRVVHRRADRVRRRTLHEASGRLVDETHAVIDFHGDGGLYIKELVSGDEGRTVPSLSAAADVRARVTCLDVLEVCTGDVPQWMELREGCQ